VSGLMANDLPFFDCVPTSMDIESGFDFNDTIISSKPVPL